MEYYIPLTEKEFSLRKLEEYTRFEKIINWGRKDPVRFAEEFYGIKLIDYQNGVLCNLSLNHLFFGYVQEVLGKPLWQRCTFKQKWFLFLTIKFLFLQIL